jgi:chromosome segregation protein
MSSENTSVENTNNEALESKVAELESVVSTHITEKETLMQEKEALVKETQTLAETHAAELEAIKAELDKANQELAAYKSKEEEMKKKEMKMKRMAELVETGLDTTEASETLESMDAFSDEQFELVLAAMKKMTQAKKMMASTEVETESTKESIADASTLDTVEVEPEVNLAISEEEDTSAIEATRASLIDFVKSRLQITK